MNPDEPAIDRLRDLLADRALQGLDDDDRSELARLAFEVEAEALALELAAAEVDLALESAPFEGLPDSLRKRLEDDADDFLARPIQAGTLPPRPIIARVVPWLGWVAAASLLFATRAQQAPPTPDRSREPTLAERLAGVGPLSLASTDHPLARGGGGELVWSADRQEGYLALKGLAEVEPDRGVYQLWIFDATRDDRFPVDGGTFAVQDAGQTTLVPIHPPLAVRSPTLFAVTLEPPGGVVVSDRKRILLTTALKP